MARSSSPLRAVSPDEKPPAHAAPKTVTQAAKSGTQRELLVAMRDRIALAVENENTPARDLAALTKRLMEVARDIKALDVAAEQEGQGGGEVEDGQFDASAV